MFNSLSPAKAYQRVGIESDFASASPHKLITLLYQGAISAVATAKNSLEDGQIAAKGTATSKAIDIILNGLLASLNLEQGGDLGRNLADLYEYMANRLLRANLENDAAGFDEVIGLLTTLHGAWLEIADKVEADGAGAA